MVKKATTTKRTVTTKVRMQRRKAQLELAIEELLVRLVTVVGSVVATPGRGEAKIFRAATKMRKRRKQSQPSRIRTPNHPEVVASK